jgi:hypothetical protein
VSVGVISTYLNSDLMFALFALSKGSLSTTPLVREPANPGVFASTVKSRPFTALHTADARHEVPTTYQSEV